MIWGQSLQSIASRLQARLFYHNQLGTDSYLSMDAASSYILNGAGCGLARWPRSAMVWWGWGPKLEPLAWARTPSQIFREVLRYGSFNKPLKLIGGTNGREPESVRASVASLQIDH